MSLVTLEHLQTAATYGRNYTAQIEADVNTTVQELTAEIEALQSTAKTLTSENEELDTRITLLEYALIQNDTSVLAEV